MYCYASPSRGAAGLPAALIVAILWSSGSFAQSAADDRLPRLPVKDFAGQPTHRVLEVRSVDTLVIRAQDAACELRLIGVDVPGTGQSEEDGRRFLERLLEGESVYVEQERGWPQCDERDRRWAYVYRAPDGLPVNLELIRLGYARVAADQRFEHQQLWLAYEQVARRGQKGLWARQAVDAAAAPATQPTADRSGGHGGATPTTATRRAATGNVTVYVTQHGRKYHSKDCRFVRTGGVPLTLQEAKARGYTPCSHCNPPE